MLVELPLFYSDDLSHPNMSSEPTAPLFGLTDDADGFVKAGFDYVVIGEFE